MLDFLLEAMETFYHHPDFYKYLSIPVLAGLIGWGTNWVCIKMTLWPTEFIGLVDPWIGWQGVVPRKVKKMGGILVDQVINQLGSLEDFFKQLEPEKIGDHFSIQISERVEEYTDELMLQRNAVMWENLPLGVKKRLYKMTKRRIPKIMDKVIQRLSENIEEIIDVKEMIVNQLYADKAYMVRLLLEIGKPEFDFVVKSGLLFGFPMGVIQMVLWYQYPNPWLLPAFGILVGGCTNYLALNLIFRPLNPVNIFGYKLQGTFLKRQEEVAEAFCRNLTREILTVETLMHEITAGPGAERAKAIIRQEVKPFVEDNLVKTMAQLTVGLRGYSDLKQDIEERILAISSEHAADPVLNKERGAMAEVVFQARMKSMTSEQFQQLLRPAFKEDEWILIALGCCLGFVAGLCQLVFVFGESLF